MAYSAVAVTRDHAFIPFGPAFATEDDAWRWLHFEALDEPMPVHHHIEVFPTALFAQLR